MRVSDGVECSSNLLRTHPIVQVIDQAIIAGCGIATVYLSQDTRPHLRRWACIVGLCAQPAWFYSASVDGNAGIFVASIAFTLGWARGVWNFWIRKGPA